AKAIREVLRLEQEDSRHKCVRCGREMSSEEHTRSQQAFQRSVCDNCFDEVFLYQQEGKRLISIYPPDKARLDAILRGKLALFGHHVPGPAGRGSASASEPAPSD